MEAAGSAVFIVSHSCANSANVRPHRPAIQDAVLLRQRNDPGLRIEPAGAAGCRPAYAGGERGDQPTAGVRQARPGRGGGRREDRRVGQLRVRRRFEHDPDDDFLRHGGRCARWKTIFQIVLIIVLAAMVMTALTVLIAGGTVTAPAWVPVAAVVLLVLAIPRGSPGNPGADSA